MIDHTYNYSGETNKIIGLAMDVQKNLGNGFRKIIYQRANNHLNFDYGD